MRHFTWLIAATLALCLTLGAARADQRIHDQVKPSLARLFVTGIARIGPDFGTEVDSKGTGFFVGTDGYILTTAHLFDPLKEVNAANTKIRAKFVGTGTGDVEVLYVSELASLDLVLLRAFTGNGIPVPPSLVIGHSDDIDQANSVLLTSGFDRTTGSGLTDPRKKTLEFNSTSNPLANFAWTLNGKTVEGASGSPVYIDRDGAPLVVGVLKGIAKDDDQLSLMIPIENSFQLIGQFKMQELIEEVAELRRIIGEIPDEKPPLNDRVSDIETSVSEIESSFTWTAEADDQTGSLVIQYRKIVSDGPQVDEIAVKVQSFFYAVNQTDKIRYVQTGTVDKAIIQLRHSLAENGRVGIFVLPGIRTRLTNVILGADGTSRDQEPLRDITLSINAKSGGTEFQTKLTIVPKFTWVYDTN